ncbi:hypothetical protein GCM10011359_25240 [Nesterenkonia alkaliphila]|nr:hypothetical protein GCM10011359_25240 [Nesterenkonia alkaliphila]
MSAEGRTPAAPGDQPPKRRGHRRVTAPGTSGQPEELESEVYDPLQGAGEGEQQDSDSLAEWLKREKPPHW